MWMLNEEHLQVRDMVRRFAEEVVAPRARELDETESFPHEAVRQMGELGLMGLPYPEKYGGAGMDMLSYAIAVEEVARVCASTAITLAAHVSLGCGPVYGAGSEDQTQRFLTPMAKGEAIGAFGLTEPNAGSDAAGTQTRAVRQGDHYQVNGSKIYITNASYAKYITFTAVTDPSQGTNGISAFIMDTATPGFRVGKKEKKMGLRGSDTVEVVFEDCVVPADQLLGDPFSLDMERVLTLFNRWAPGVRVVGGLASAAPRPKGNTVILNDWVSHEGGLAIALHGALRADVVVSQGCEPIGPPLDVTHVEDNVIMTLDVRSEVVLQA